VILWKTSHSASEGDITMTAPSSIDPVRFLHDQLASASPDLLRSMLTTFVDTLMSAEADAICGAPYGMPGPDRVNVRNGYRHRDFDTRAGTLDVAIPKLRQGSYFPDWLLERRRRAEAALTSVVATCYLLGVSTRRMEKLVESLGITRLSKSQVSVMAADLDAAVEDFRTRPLDAGPYTFVAADALVLKVREGGRVVNVHALLATGVNADGHREILGLQVTSAEDGAGWLGFFRDLTARGLAGVALVTSDAHRGLTEAIGATLPGAAWQRCRTHRSRKETTWWFSVWGSMGWYGDLARGPRSAGVEVRGAAASSERAAAAVAAGGRGPVAGAWRGPGSRPVGRGEREHRPQGRLRAGGGPGSVPGRPCETRGRGPQERRRTGCGAGPGAAGAG
jgi:putative transposase